MTTMEGWVGIIFTTYFSPGSVCLTIFGLCLCDLLTGSMLALKTTRYLRGERYETNDFPELESLIATGKVKPFSWVRWSLWAEKMSVTFVLIFGCELFRFWIAHDRPWTMPGLDFGIGVIYFVLCFTNLHSIIRNVALITENRMLLVIWKWLGAHADNSLDAVLRIKAEKQVEIEVQGTIVAPDPPALILPPSSTDATTK